MKMVSLRNLILYKGKEQIITEPNVNTVSGKIMEHIY